MAREVALQQRGSVLGRTSCCGWWIVLSQLRKIFSVLPCSHRCLFADNCHMKNITGYFFQLQNKNFVKMPLSKDYKPTTHGMSGKIIPMKLLDWSLSLIFKKTLSVLYQLLTLIYWLINCARRCTTSIIDQAFPPSFIFRNPDVLYQPPPPSWGSPHCGGPEQLLPWRPGSGQLSTKEVSGLMETFSLV